MKTLARKRMRTARGGRFLAGFLGLGLGLALAAGVKADVPEGVSPTAAAPMTLTSNLPLLGQTQWTGFLQNWSTWGEKTGNGPHTYDLAGDYLKFFQVGFTSQPYPGVQLVTLSELAARSVPSTGAVPGGTYGITLLNAYLAVDLSSFTGSAVPLTLTAGQFKTHFGLNRMYRADHLTLVDYSSIYNGPTGVMGGNPQYAPYWDDGLQLAWSRLGWLEADAAWVNGEGPNLGAPSTTVLGQPQGEYVANVSVWPVKIWELGASYLYGEMFSPPGTVLFPGKPKTFTDEYTRFALPGRSFALEAEFVNRSGNGNLTPDVNPAVTSASEYADDRNGLTVTLSQYLCDRLQLAFGYDRIVIYGDDGEDSVRYLGGVNYWPYASGPLRFSLMQMGKASGPSQQPSSSWTILQSQVSF